MDILKVSSKSNPVSVAGAIAGNSNTTTSQVQREVHLYTFVLKVNDISNPSWVIQLPSLNVAEEVAATFMIFCQGITPKEEPTEVIVESIPKKSDDNIKIDKFEEIKKYKELFDMGIISQEEFDNKKKELI